MASATFLWDLTWIVCLAHSIVIDATDEERWENSTHVTCKDLNYQEQFCNVTDHLEWNCLKEKAVAQDRNSCINSSKVGNLSIPMNDNSAHEYTTLCSLYEVCAFTEDNFKCSDGSRPLNYTCTSPEYGILNCTVNNQTYVTKNCTPSLIHCDPVPFNSDCYDIEHDSEHGKQFRNNCIEGHEESIWYYAVFTHYNNTSTDQDTLKSTHPKDWKGNNDLLCNPSVEVEDTTKKIVLIVTVLVIAMVAVVALVYTFKEGKKKLEHKKKTLKTSVDQFTTNHLAHLFNRNTSSRSEPQTREKVDEISYSELPESEDPSDTIETTSAVEGDTMEGLENRVELVNQTYLQSNTSFSINSDGSCAGFSQTGDNHEDRPSLSSPGVCENSGSSRQPFYSNSENSGSSRQPFYSNSFPVCDSVLLNDDQNFVGSNDTSAYVSKDTQR